MYSTSGSDNAITPFVMIISSIYTHLIGGDIETVDDGGQTPLHVACGEGYLDVVQFLLSKGRK